MAVKPIDEIGQEGGFGLYIHWPYCARICPYCDFNVYKQRDDTDLCAAIIDDILAWRALTGPRELSAIHFGGGTPSLMTPDDIAAILDAVDKRAWGIPRNCEIAIEANPQDADAARWEAYRDAGLTRLSLGVQTFNDKALKMLGRDHDGEKAAAALALAVHVFPSVSADIIFGWAGQTAADLDADLDRVIASGAQHVSAYQLTIEEGTAFAKAEARGQSRAVGNNESADFYDQVCERITGAGFEHYEVSNFARPAHRSRHNSVYWQGGDYAGVGPGAHGRLTQNGMRIATVAALRPAEYVNAVSGGIGIAEQDALSAVDWGNEYVMMGLRIAEGINLNRYTAITNQSLSEAELSDLIAMGFLSRDGERVFATAQGRPVLNMITQRLLT